jgi:hypothetical protein
MVVLDQRPRRECFQRFRPTNRVGFQRAQATFIALYEDDTTNAMKNLGLENMSYPHA